MDEHFHYTDPRGRRSGPFSSAELRSLAGRGLLEPDGVVDDGSGLASWRVGDLGWPPRPSADPGTQTAPGPSGPAGQPEAPPPDAGPLRHELRSAGDGPIGDPARAAIPQPGFGVAEPPRLAPPVSPDDPSVRRVDAPTVSSLSRTAYVLLAVLLIPFFAFGVHNLAAGYIGRGVVQLLLGLMSLATVAAGGWFAPLCCCFGGPLYAALAVWSVVDAITVNRDAHGLRLA